MKTDVIAMVLAGGRGTRLNIIASGRAKPAVPFGGSYRIIDFTLTNIMQSGIRYAGILTQYRPQSLMIHLGDGEPWDLAGHASLLKILPPVFKRSTTDWYGGTADAIYQNLDFIRRLDPDYVLILSGDHIYSMDYRLLIEKHRKSRAELTIAAMEVPWNEVGRFGTINVDRKSRVTGFVEKDPKSTSNLASMGIYVFSREILEEALTEQHRQGGLDFGKHVIPAMLAGGARIYTHKFHGYWRDVGTLHSYWQANMDIIEHLRLAMEGGTDIPEDSIDLDAWAVRTNRIATGRVQRLPARFLGKAEVGNSIVSVGCVVEGKVVNSVLFPGVSVGPGATIRDSVVMNDCEIGADATVEKSILDKLVVVGCHASIGNSACSDGRNRRFPTSLFGGLTVIGKESRIPAEARVGANVIVNPGLSLSSFGNGSIADGETVQTST